MTAEAWTPEERQWNDEYTRDCLASLPPLEKSFCPVRRSLDCGALAVCDPRRSFGGASRPWFVVDANHAICHDHYPTQALSDADVAQWTVLY